MSKTIKHYDDFLDDILIESNLAHGYDLSVEGTYCGHRIFEKSSMVKNSFPKRVLHPIKLHGQRYSVSTVAMFEEEPWYNRMKGCWSDKVARITVTDQQYTSELEQVIEKIKEYSEQRKDNTINVLTREKNPIVLSIE